MKTNDQNTCNDHLSRLDPLREVDNRRRSERREQESEGYTYISMVGWMDRRCKTRRKGDAIDFCHNRLE